MRPMVIDLPLRAAGLAGDDPSAEAGYDPRLDGLCGLGGLSLGAKLGELEQFARLMQTQGQAVEEGCRLRRLIAPSTLSA